MLSVGSRKALEPVVKRRKYIQSLFQNSNEKRAVALENRLLMELSPVQSLFLSQKFSDVTFIIESKQIAAHKAILAAGCPYLETMLFGATNESKMITIELKKVSYKIFVEVLRAIYHQKVDIKGWSAEEVKSLILIADEYQFSRLGQIVTETLSENQVTVDIVDDIYGVGKRLNCGQLILKCEEFAQKNLALLLSNGTTFDKLSMDLIGHLMDRKVFDPQDRTLMHSISNWRNTGLMSEKMTLLSKLDWKDLPREYSEPLLRTLLQSGDSGLTVKNWCQMVKAPVAQVIQVASVYDSFEDKFLDASVLQTFLYKGCKVLRCNTKGTNLIIHFRDPICDVVRIAFTYSLPSQVLDLMGSLLDLNESISLTVIGKSGILQGKQENEVSSPPFSYKFALPKKADILVMRISFKMTNITINSGDNGQIHNFEF